MSLEITRSFIQNRDGTYEPFKCPKVEVESIPETYGRLEKQPVLRPLELKTFLKVGKLVACGKTTPPQLSWKLIGSQAVLLPAGWGWRVRVCPFQADILGFSGNRTTAV